MKISFFKKLGVGWKRAAPHASLTLGRPAVSKLNHVCDLNQPQGAECFEMDGGRLGNH
ncbi:hypothetical protein [Cyclobacterium roseum]|uniref:hypothetical protein n=1 Tax=Cyclobacterium roseum TaxID=2666137 RepID=UPI001390A5E1|nr:hypothetical protein [Cyclobacterium roseum]